MKNLLLLALFLTFLTACGQKSTTPAPDTKPFTGKLADLKTPHPRLLLLKGEEKAGL